MNPNPYKIKKLHSLNDNDNFDENKKKRRRKIFLFAGLFFLIYLFVGGDHGLYHFWVLKKEKGKLKDSILLLKAEQQQLEKENQKLKNDKKTIEKVAREKYGMAKKGEKIYKVVPETK